MWASTINRRRSRLSLSVSVFSWGCSTGRPQQSGSISRCSRSGNLDRPQLLEVHHSKRGCRFDHRADHQECRGQALSGCQRLRCDSEELGVHSSPWNPGSLRPTGLHRVRAVLVFQKSMGQLAIPITVSVGVVPARKRSWTVVGGVAGSPFFWRGVSGIGDTVEKCGGVGLKTADAPRFGWSDTGLEKCLTSAGTKVGADPWIPSV